MLLKVKKFIFFLLLIFCCSVKLFAAPVEYENWLKNLRKEMISSGIKAEFFDRVYAVDYYESRPEVLKKDKAMQEFLPTSYEYLNRIVTKERVNAARKKYEYAKKQYNNMETVVPLHYLVAFWSLETNFGKNKGNFNLIKSLTMLAFYGRRTDYFRKELYYALKIIQDNNLDFKEVKSSWDGGIGHFQFMPSTYNNFAVDYDNNGKIDLWNDEADAFASANKYLIYEGWQKDKIWGTEVEIPWNFDYANSGNKNKKTYAEWQKLGIKANIPESMKNDESYLFLPEGNRGIAYLVFKNFEVITRWNHSSNYALSVGILADYIISDKKWQEIDTFVYKNTKEDIKNIQNAYNRVFKKQIRLDGRLGPETRHAVQSLQKKYKLSADGYPDWNLLKRIKNRKKYENYRPLPPKKQKS